MTGLGKYGFSLLLFMVMIMAWNIIAFAQETTPLTLEQAVNKALSKNLTLESDRLDKKSSDWAVGQSVSGYLPRVYFTSTWSRLDQQTLDDANQYYDMGLTDTPAVYEDTYQSSITIAQPIFNQGAEVGAIWGASVSAKERKYNLENSTLATVRDVKKTYFNLLTATQAMDLAKEAVSLAEESLNSADTRYQVGQVNKTEVLRWETNLANAQGQYIEAENANENAQITLANILGEDLNRRYIPTSLSTDKINSDLADAALSNQAYKGAGNLTAHPSVMQLTQSVNAAKVSRFIETGKLLPGANFTYSYNWESNDTLELDGDQSWNMGIQVQIPLFQSLGGICGIGKSQRAYQKAKKSKENFVRGLLQQLKMAQLQIRSATKRVFAADKGQKFAEENLILVTEQHKLGITSNLELVDAQFAYTQARSNYIKAVGDFYIALADYEYVTTQSQQ